MRTIRLVLITVPWIIILGIVLWNKDQNEVISESKSTTTILTEMESLGKLELVKYNFKEITELKELSKKYFKIFQLGPDSKIALISEGQAVGCLDLTKINKEDISQSEDTLYVRLPDPELCYYKLDLSKTKIYSLQTNPLNDEKEFIKRAYKEAEEDIKRAALSGGILDQTTANAEKMLKPLLKKLTSKEIVFTTKIPDTQIDMKY